MRNATKQYIYQTYNDNYNLTKVDYEQHCSHFFREGKRKKIVLQKKMRRKKKTLGKIVWKNYYKFLKNWRKLYGSCAAEK